MRRHRFWVLPRGSCRSFDDQNTANSANSTHGGTSQFCSLTGCHGDKVSLPSIDFAWCERSLPGSVWPLIDYCGSDSLIVTMDEGSLKAKLCIFMEARLSTLDLLVVLVLLQVSY